MPGINILVDQGHTSKPLLGAVPDFGHPLNRGLEAWFPCNEGSGLVLNDISVNKYRCVVDASGHDPTLDWRGSPHGYGFHFDGGDANGGRLNDDDLKGKFPMQNNGNGADSFSVAGWMNTISSSGRQIICSKQKTDPTSRGFALMRGGGAGLPFQFEIAKDNSTISSAQTSTSIVSRRWYYVVGTYEFLTGGNSILKIYLNGSLDGINSSAVGPPFDNAVQFQIGTYLNNSGLDGEIDDVRVWSRVLNEDEVHQLYTMPYSPILRAKRWHRFEPVAPPSGTVPVFMYNYRKRRVA